MNIKESNTYRRLVSNPKDNNPTMVILHHTGGTDANPKEDTSHHTAAIIESWHLAKGWEGIGYTYVIEKDGTIVKGRPEHYHGAHTVNYNKKSIGICMSGNFDATLPTKEQEQSFKLLYKDINTRYPNLPVYPHRKFEKKTCYGTGLIDDYGQKLADSALAIKPEIEDDSKEALEYCRKQNEEVVAENKEYKSLLSKIFSLLKIKQ